jgi:hypothetical protein
MILFLCWEFQLSYSVLCLRCRCRIVEGKILVLPDEVWIRQKYRFANLGTWNVSVIQKLSEQLAI